MIRTNGLYHGRRTLDKQPYIKLMIMKNVEEQLAESAILVDFSSDSELAYWSAKLKVRKELIKTAARACCSNEVSKIKQYLTQKYAARKSRPLL